MATIPVFKLVIDPNSTDGPDGKNFSGVDFVALVDEPAIERYFQAFKAHEKVEIKKKFTFSNEDRRLVCGPLMIPNLPIYRKEGDSEYYAVFDNKTIEQIAQKFFKQGFTANVNEMHDPAAKVGDVYMVESFIIDPTRGINAPTGFEYLPEGTWFGSYKVENDDVWASVKDGTFKGFSVEGFFKMIPDTISDEQAIEAIRTAILS